MFGGAVHTVKERTPKILSWHDKVLTPAIEVCLVGAAICGTYMLAVRFDISSFSSLVLFFLLNTLITLLFLWLLRQIFPIREGVYHVEKDVWMCYRWKLHHFLHATNLFYHYQNSLLPTVFRKYLNRLLGGSSGGGAHQYSRLDSRPLSCLYIL